MKRAAGRAESSEIVSLADRMGYIQALRVGFAVVVLASAAFASRVVGASVADLVLITAAYLLGSALSEGLRRVFVARGLTLVGLMLLVDAAYLSWVVYSTGGVLSPLRFLFYVHLIAVTLLASYRTGLKLAMWYSLLYLVSFYAQAAGVVEVREGVAGALPGQGPMFTQVAAFNIVALWIVAIGTAVFSSMNERELRRNKHDLQALTNMAHELESVSDPATIARSLLDDVCDTFKFKRGVVLAGQDRNLTLLAFRGPGEAPAAPPDLDPVIEQAWAEHDAVLVKKLDPERDKRLTGLLPFARNVVIVPLFAEGAPIGVVAVEHPTARIERRTLALLGQFTSHAALALRNAWLLEQVQTMAETDALTGVANRRTFEETLMRELSRSARTGEPLSLAMFDVDHFKRFNDEYGHQAGDDILVQVAKVLSAASRDFDIVARYGGEEFAVVLPGLAARESLAVVERLRKAISSIDAVAPLAASAGVATFPNHALDAVTLVRNADEALYESKRAGRDRVTRSRRRPTVRQMANSTS